MSMSTYSKGAVRLKVIAAVIAGVTFLAAPLESLAADDRPSVAVLGFEVGDINRWWNWRLENEITELVTNGLIGKGDYRLVERSHIDQILREQNFSASARVDSTTAARMGKLIGARFVVIGTITDFSIASSGGMRIGRLGISTSTARTALTARIIDVETGEIVASSSGVGEETGVSLSVSNFKGLSFNSSEFKQSSLGKSVQTAVDDFCENVACALSQACTAMASRAADAMQMKGSVIALVGSNVVINVGADAGVKHGQLYGVFRLTDVPGLPDPVRVPVGIIKIISVDPKAAVAQVEQSSMPIEAGDVIALQ